MDDSLKYQNTQMILCDNLFMRARGLCGTCQMKSRAFAVENCHLKTSPRKLGECYTHYEYGSGRPSSVSTRLGGRLSDLEKRGKVLYEAF